MSGVPTIPTSYEDMFDAFFTRSYELAYRVLGDVAAAEDVAQEALARTYVHWERIRDLPHRDGWVLRVTANLAIDAVRRRPLELPGRQPALSPQDLVDTRLALGAALRSLPRRQREAVVLRYLGDLSSADVAAMLHISTGSVNVHVHRGLKALRERLGAAFSEVTADAEA